MDPLLPVSVSWSTSVGHKDYSCKCLVPEPLGMIFGHYEPQVRISIDHYELLVMINHYLLTAMTINHDSPLFLFPNSFCSSSLEFLGDAVLPAVPSAFPEDACDGTGTSPELILGKHHADGIGMAWMWHDRHRVYSVPTGYATSIFHQ